MTARFRPARVTQTLRAAAEAGLTVAEVIVEPNGRVRVIFADGRETAIDAAARDEGLRLEQAMHSAFAGPAGGPGR